MNDPAWMRYCDNPNCSVVTFSDRHDILCPKCRWCGHPVQLLTEAIDALRKAL